MTSESLDNQKPTTETEADQQPAAETQTGSPDQGTSALAEQLEAARKEAAENYERYVRSLADLDNFRRRAQREKEDLRLYAANKVLEDLLPVLDNLGLGLAAAQAPNADMKTLLGGISMVADQLKNALSSHGLTEINPVGQPFDPNLHEAVSHIPDPKIEEGNVSQVIRTGYSLNGRLLRAATVVVSSGPAKDSE